MPMESDMQLSEIRIKPLRPYPGVICACTLRNRFESCFPTCPPTAIASRFAPPRSTRGGRLRAFCSLTFDNSFVLRDVKLIEGNDGLFLAMPSRKLCDRCRRCGEKNHLRARFCNQCGTRLDETRHQARPGNGYRRSMVRPKLHADIAHPINAECRLELERRVLMAYLEELERSKLPPATSRPIWMGITMTDTMSSQPWLNPRRICDRPEPMRTLIEIDSPSPWYSGERAEDRGARLRLRRGGRPVGEIPAPWSAKPQAAEISLVQPWCPLDLLPQ